MAVQVYLNHIHITRRTAIYLSPKGRLSHFPLASHHTVSSVAVRVRYAPRVGRVGLAPTLRIGSHNRTVGFEIERNLWSRF